MVTLTVGKVGGYLYDTLGMQFVNVALWECTMMENGQCVHPVRIYGVPHQLVDTMALLGHCSL